jgi:4-aminobutyrate aminotransferase-like enzyme
MLDHGFLVGVGGYYGNVMRFQPPLVISEADLDRAVDALGEALDAV